MQAIRDAGEFGRAAALLRAYLADHPGDARAELVLAEALYWQGDLTGAARHFRRVLASDSGNVAARRELGEIRAVSAPSITFGAYRGHDTQPIDRTQLMLNARVFLTPLWSLDLDALPERARDDATQLDGADVTAGLRGYVPAARLEVGVTAGGSPWRSTAGAITQTETALIGSARVGVRTLPGLTVAADLERARYRWTMASLATPVMTTSARALLHFDRRGWLGEAAFQRITYPDDNATRIAYAWLLAPIASAAGASFQLGYAFAYQNAEETRFTPAAGYVPYFTPADEIAHSAAASLALWSRSGVRLQLGGSYAVYAVRNVPRESGPLVRFTRETFEPYEARASLAVPLSKWTELKLDASRVRTSYYEYTRAGVTMTLRRAPRPIR